jgi:predicted nucleic acid-binding protein
MPAPTTDGPVVDGLPGAKGVSVAVSLANSGLMNTVPRYQIAGGPNYLALARLAWKNNVVNPEFRESVIRGFLDEGQNAARYSWRITRTCGPNLHCSVGVVVYDTGTAIASFDVGALAQITPESLGRAACPAGNCGETVGRGLFMVLSGGEGRALVSIDDVWRVFGRGSDELLSTRASGAGGSVVLDTNAVIAAVEKGEIASVLKGRSPVVPITVVREFLQGGGSVDSLRTFLRMNGGRIGLAGKEEVAAQLRAQAGLAGRSLGLGDSRVAASALREGLSVVTRDKQFRNFLSWVGIGGEAF